MAAPRDRLRAQDGHRLALRHFDQPFQVGFKFRSPEVIRIPSKACVAPAGVGRTSPWVAKSAQSLKVRVLDAGGREGPRQSLLVELGVVPGSRDRADINEEL